MSSSALANLSAMAHTFEPTLNQLFADDPIRAQRFCAEGAGIRLDYSKHWLTESVRDALVAGLEAVDFGTKRAALVNGDLLNLSEQRAVLHMALRGEAGDPFAQCGSPIMPSILSERSRCFEFAEAVRNGTLCGATGRAFTDVLSLGIGGSDLGPMMVAEALKPWIDGPRPHYVANIDGADLADTLAQLDPETTLCVVASKTFTTQETLHNAKKVKAWFSQALGTAAVGAHLAAVSTNVEAVRAFGIATERMFPFSDWVGGRYSVWSSIGLSLMISLGPDDFAEFLAGARAMDQHFLQTPLHENIPVLMALLGVWYRNGFGFESHAVIPYAQRLVHFPAYVQALEMESNGKRVSASGEVLDHHTSALVWGQIGTNGQHAFFQALHQGTLVSPIDFIVTAKPVDTDTASHRLLVANCLAQAEALAFGQSQPELRAEMQHQGLSGADIERLRSHRTFPGNRPSSLLMLSALTPKSLGALMAAYEHKVFTQGVYWGINSFDQWGVELGKARARTLAPMLGAGDIDGFSTSTQDAARWLFRDLD